MVGDPPEAAPSRDRPGAEHAPAPALLVPPAPVPPPPVLAPPAPAGPVPPPPDDDGPEPDDDLDATVVSDRRSTPGWTIVLDDGAQQAVSGQVLIGRRVKGPDPRWPSARLLTLVDTTKSVSKVHALLEADRAAFRVTDLGSTNGVIIAAPDGTEIDLATGATSEVIPGSSVILGNYTMRVEKN